MPMAMMRNMWSKVSMMASSNTAFTIPCRDRRTPCPAYWQPTTSGQYAGACILLIVLAIVLRVLANFHTPAAHRKLLRRRGDDGAAAVDKLPLAERVTADPHASQVTPTANRVYELAWAVTAPLRGPVLGGLLDLPELAVRMALDMTMMVIMWPVFIAVRTMNVGYIMSVLVGYFFVGMLIVRRYFWNWN
jgi:Ctr copper transporter family